MKTVKAIGHNGLFKVGPSHVKHSASQRDMDGDWMKTVECNVGRIPGVICSASVLYHAHVFPFILSHIKILNGHMYIYICMYVLIDFEPDIKWIGWFQNQSFLKWKQCCSGDHPGLISLCENVIVCMCVCAFVCVPRFCCKYEYNRAHTTVCFSSKCVCVSLCVGITEFLHPSVYRREWKVMGGMEREGPVMT